MMANQWDFEFLRNTIELLLPRHFETLVDIGLNLNQAREHLFSKLPEMQAWAEIFVRAEPRVGLIELFLIVPS
jgi:DNA replication ATP-dependent helicase Dna2